MTLTLTPAVVRYLVALFRQYIDGAEDPDGQYAAWFALTGPEKDEVNAFASLVMEEWL